MNFVSLFSGIGGFDLGFERAGMTPVAQVEIDPHALSVLARRWPDVPRHTDVRTFGKDSFDGAADLVCGGFPCQDLSVAGKRAGLAGKRSGLWFQFHRVLAELRPGWVVIENVPGLLSSGGGRDLATVLHGLGNLGYLSAWRVLDAQYLGVAQRRRRVFIVGSLGNGRCAEVLFESEGVRWNPPARRAAGEGTAWDVAPSLAASGRGTERAGESRGQDCVIPVAFGGGNPNDIGVSTTLNHHGTRQDFESETFIFEPRYARNGRGAPDTIAPPLKAENGNTGKGDGAPVVMYYTHDYAHERIYDSNGIAPARATHSNVVRQGFMTGSGVRRLTPTECERLQGFPDGWTAQQSDSQRYKQLGNAVAVPVAEWIGRRIMEVETR